MKYNLFISCNGQKLSNDKCNGINQLKDTFDEAYEHYIGIIPNKVIRDIFLKNKNYDYFENGIIYSFDYYEFDN